MRSMTRWFRHWPWCIGVGLGLLRPGLALAHERFIPHELLIPLQRDFFRRLDPNMLNIAMRVAILMAVLLFVWFLREPLWDFTTKRLLRWVQGKPMAGLRLLVGFLTDKPLENLWFIRASRWAIVLFLRCPALVLMYSASNNALVMPSYPLEPALASVFKYAQVMMAMGIITQTLLPFGGATIFGTFIYLLYAFDWKIAVDILPILTVAVVYVSSPWLSYPLAITDVSQTQARWVRIVLGFGFLALGWMKIYNHDLTAGVADNFPSIMADPLILMFYVGTDPALQRECWIVAFAMTEVLTGFLIMAGVFTRLWSVMMVYVFTKLMLVDFGWAEIPHLYPIGGFLALALSNRLSCELSRFDVQETYETQPREMALRILRAAGAAIAITAVVIFPMLYGLTLVEHP